MGKFNPGSFKGDAYEKEVDWNKAVLWMSREISLNPSIAYQFRERGTKFVRFIDKRKGIVHEATVEDLRANRSFKTVGQEKQFYFPIGIFKTKELKKDHESSTHQDGRDGTPDQPDGQEAELHA